MRQLSQLEKRLLRIYAIEKQMTELGAVGYVDPETGEILGDYEKTINSAANMAKQLSTVFAEWSKYLGQILVTYVKPILKYGLAIMITLREITKSFATLNNYVAEEFNQNGMVSLFGETTEAIEETENALNGLLSFDKFEALSSNNTVSDDLQSILDAIVNYESAMDGVSSKATAIAEKILTWLGFTQEVVETTDSYGNVIQDTIWKLKDGETNLRKIKEIVQVIVSIGLSALTLKLTSALYKMIAALITAENTGMMLNKVLGTLLLASIINIIMNFDDMSKKAKIVNTTLLILSTTLLLLKNRLLIATIVKKLSTALIGLDLLGKQLAVTLTSVTLALGLLAAGIAIFAFMDQMSAKTKILVGVLATLVGSLTAAATAWMIYHGAMTLGAAIPVILGAATVGAAGIYSLIRGVQQFADGGVPKEGSLFIANEKGPELVGNIGGQSAVANNDMIVSAIENAAYRGMVKAMQVQNGSHNTVEFSFTGTTDGAIARAMATPMIDELRRQGYKVEKS